MLSSRCHPLPGSGHVALSLEVRLGWRHEPGSRRGIVHMLEHARLLGSTRHPRPDETTRPWGVTIDGRTDVESSALTAVCLPDDVPRVVPVLVDLLFRPALDSARLAVEREVVASSRTRREDFAPWSWARLKLDDILFATDELASLGTADSVATWTRDELLAWHRRFDHPANACLLAAGETDATALADVLGPLAVSSGGGERPRVIRTEPASRCHHEPREGTSSELYLGFAFEPQAWSPAVELLRVLVGNFPASRLWRRFRTETALAYMVDASLCRRSDANRLALYVGLSRPDAAARVWEGLRELVAELGRRPPDEEELAWARRTAALGLRRRGASPEGALALLRERSAADPDARASGVEEPANGFARVSAEDVCRAAEAILRPERAALSVVGEVGAWRPAEALAAWVAG